MRKALFALLAIALMVLVACAPKESAPAAPIGEQPTASEKTAPSAEEVTPAEEISADYSGLELLNDVVCLGDRVTATITNNGEKTWTLAKNIKIILNGGWDEEPGCDKDSIEPGESTVCDMIDFPVIIKTRKNVLVVAVDGENAIEEFYCTATEE